MLSTLLQSKFCLKNNNFNFLCNSLFFLIVTWLSYKNENILTLRVFSDSSVNFLAFATVTFNLSTVVLVNLLFLSFPLFICNLLKILFFGKLKKYSTVVYSTLHFASLNESQFFKFNNRIFHTSKTLNSNFIWQEWGPNRKYFAPLKINLPHQFLV